MILSLFHKYTLLLVILIMEVTLLNRVYRATILCRIEYFYSLENIMDPREN